MMVTMLGSPSSTYWQLLGLAIVAPKAIFDISLLRGDGGEAKSFNRMDLPYEAMHNFCAC